MHAAIGPGRQPLPGSRYVSPSAGHRSPAQNSGRGKGLDGQLSDPRNRAHPVRQDGRSARLARRDRPRRHRDRGRAGALRRRPRAGRAGRLRPGPAGRPGSDPLAPGPDQGRHPEGGPLGDDQQGLRLRYALARPRRPGDPRRRPRGRGHRRHGVDEPGALPAAGRPLRLPDGRRGGARRDDPRRPHQPLHRQADDQRGFRGLQRDGDHPRRDGPIRRPLAAARRRGDRGRPHRRRDRRGDGQGPQGRHHGRGRRGAAPADDARDARQAEGDRRRGRDPHRRQRPGRQRRRRGDRRRLRGVGAGGRQDAAGEGPLLRDRRRRLRLPRPHPRQRRPKGAREDRQDARPTSTSGRSTRPSPRS